MSPVTQIRISAAMARQTTTDDRLDGWDAISDYLGWHARTVIRWEKQKGLPVHRVPGGKRQPVYAYRHEIDQWFEKHGDTGPIAASAPAIVGPDLAPKSLSSPTPARRISRLTIVTAGTVAILLVSALGIAWRLPTRPSIQITGVTQLTEDGMAKRNLVTDGRQLYFTEDVGGEKLLSTMGVSGGPISRMTVQLPNSYPEDISPDGKLLLVLSHAGVEEEYSLWIVPTADGPPFEIDGVRCGTAAWSPSGEWIAYGHGDAIYITSRASMRTRLLSQVSGIPQTIHWSADGKHLLFFLRSLSAGTTSLWQVDLDNNFNAERATPLAMVGEKCCRQDLLTRDAGGYFSVTNDSTADRLLHLRPQPWWRTKSLEASALSTHFEAVNGLAADSRSRRLFVLSGAREQGELVRYDLSSRSFTMLLPGTSATFVDWAKNMGLVTYVKSPDATLWESRADGTDTRRLSPVGMEVELPRWSPDGRSIAFMGRQTDRPWRIYVVPAAGGIPKEASKSDDNQGAPTWSPDGKFLAYGNVYCQVERTCAIHKIDLATGEISTLPESQGLATARWSPDGQHIAALNSVQHELDVFDLGRQRWRKLAEGTNGNDLGWSSDSRYVYTKSSMNGPTEILRVAVSGGPVQTVLNLDSFSKSAGQLDTWFSLMPDNALMLNRLLNTSEIYALNYRE